MQRLTQDLVIALQGEMQRQAEVVRNLDESHENPFIGKQPYFGTAENAPVSPRMMPQDDSRRQGGLTVPQARGQPLYRPTVPSNLSVGARRPYGSIGGASATQSSPLRNAAPPPPPGPHPLSNVIEASSRQPRSTTHSSPTFARRGGNQGLRLSRHRASPLAPGPLPPTAPRLKSSG